MVTEFAARFGLDPETWIGLLVFVALLLLLGGLFALLRKPPDEYPYERQPALCTPAELHFLISLSPLIREHALVFTKVRLADIIRPQPGLPKAEWTSAFRKICAKHLDFVLCQGPDLAVIGAIELDDRSHRRADRRARDEFVDAALAAAGIPILHVPVQRQYAPDKLREELVRVFGLPVEAAADYPA